MLAETIFINYIKPFVTARTVYFQMWPSLILTPLQSIVILSMNSIISSFKVNESFSKYLSRESFL